MSGEAAKPDKAIEEAIAAIAPHYGSREEVLGHLHAALSLLRGEEAPKAVSPGATATTFDVVHIQVPRGKGRDAYQAVMALLRADDGRSPGLEENVTVTSQLAA